MSLFLLCAWQFPASAGQITFTELFSHLTDEKETLKTHYLPKFSGPQALLNGVSFRFESDFVGTLTLSAYKPIALFGPNGPNATCEGALGRMVDCHKVSQNAKLSTDLAIALLEPGGSGIVAMNNVTFATACQKKRIITAPGSDLRCFSANAKEASFLDVLDVNSSDLSQYISTGALDRLKFNTSRLVTETCGDGVIGQGTTCTDTASFTGKISVTYSFGADNGSGGNPPVSVSEPATTAMLLFGLLGVVGRLRSRGVLSPKVH